jgi:hypothetical protein
MLTLYIVLGILYFLVGGWVATVSLVVFGSISGMEIGSGSTPPDPRFVYPVFFFSFLLWPLALAFIGCYVGYKKLTGS